MSPKEIAEKLITIQPKLLAPPESNILCLVYRAGYKLGLERSGVEGVCGPEHDTKFFLSTQRHFLKEVIEEVINDCIDAVYSATPTQDTDAFRESCVSAIRERFNANDNASTL